MENAPTSSSGNSDMKNAQTQPNTPNKDEIPDEITCFINNVSPIRVGQNTKYFNCNIKYGENKYVNGLVFSPNKLDEFKAIEKQKSPVKIKKFVVSDKYQNTNLIINHKSSIIQTEEPSFQPDEIINTSNIITIDTALKIALEQLITVKGKIFSMSSIKTMIFSKEKTNKQELEIADPTGNIKVMLWGQNCTEDISKNDTYIFKNFRIKSRDGFRYLVTPKSNDCSIEHTSHHAEPFKTPQSSSAQSQCEVNASLVSVSGIQQSYTCPNCNLKLTVPAGKNSAFCIKCQASHKRRALRNTMYARFTFELENTTTQIQLSGFSSQIRKLCRDVEDFDKKSPEFISDYIIENIDEVKLHYDTVKNVILDVEF